ncbi:hypothetical protein CEUSTIGMA_g5449.t1 [Chlamydomonas eustigma]|uniref:Uncharacterized protein n=1 Tax=Chlamydomonas eustigma TaxID=1157962 RepID=A0A250X4J5_9CHLO|nr:hypothetical protein CEUSTIGMA_g5449.t1 [Chlamydomonas eustigma]|eukprot:GAX78007.1 hypothetical protein CEUSTIGMA_g5449.t1 [Chlamydomonas eustigma]
MSNGRSSHSLEEALSIAENSIAEKERELRALKAAYNKALASEGLGNDNVIVLGLLRNQDYVEADAQEYENKVLNLELKSLLDRYRMLDVEGLAARNQQLSAQVMQLHEENLELSKQLSNSEMNVTRNVAKIQLALEVTTREHIREAHDKARQELTTQMDDKTKHMVAEFGALQLQVGELNKQAYVLDTRYRKLATEKQQFKVDAEVADSMNMIMSKQAVAMKHQLDRAFMMNRVLEQGIDAAEQRAIRSEQQVALLAGQLRLRVGETQAAVVTQSHDREKWTEDSTTVLLTEDELCIQDLKRKLAALRRQLEQMKSQRDMWKGRSEVHERACSELQKCFGALMEHQKLTLPKGLRQSVESVWKVESTVAEEDSALLHMGHGQHVRPISRKELFHSHTRPSTAPASGRSSLRPESPPVRSPSRDLPLGTACGGVPVSEQAEDDEVVSKWHKDSALLGSHAERSALNPFQETSCGSPEAHSFTSTLPKGRGVMSPTHNRKPVVPLSRLVSAAADPGIDLSNRSQEASSAPTRQRTASGRPHSSAVALRGHRNPGSLRYTGPTTTLWELYGGASHRPPSAYSSGPSSSLHRIASLRLSDRSNNVGSVHHETASEALSQDQQYQRLIQNNTNRKVK